MHVQGIQRLRTWKCIFISKYTDTGISNQTFNVGRNSNQDHSLFEPTRVLACTYLPAALVGPASLAKEGTKQGVTRNHVSKILYHLIFWSKIEMSP